MSLAASQEYTIATQLDQLRQQWLRVSFDVVSHGREGLKIQGFDVLLSNLDDSMSAINMVLGSRYVKRYRKEAEDFFTSMDRSLECIELWREC